MRYKEIKPLSEQRLDEINMSPASLRQLASKIDGALVGMEFELIVPNYASEEREQEPDYDSDERCQDIDQILNFFDDRDYNSNRAISSLREELNNEFYDWQNEQLAADWSNADVTGLLEKFISDNEGFEGEELDDAIANAIENQDSYYDAVREEFDEDARDEYDEEAWLKETYRYMSDIENSFSGTVTWPHWTYSSTGDTEVSEVAADFSKAIGRPATASDGYHDNSIARHDGKGSNDAYIVEPDSSIEGDNGESGLEFVSPPLSIPEMISDLRKVKAWAGRYGCETNKSTGLHINVSVPNYSLDKLDFVKLALLLGDQHVLQSFGRTSNQYCKSALALVKQKIASNPDSTEKLLTTMRGHLNTAASKAIHYGTTAKYTSINVKDGRIEFRSPGGDWLDADTTEMVENTMLRFVVALDAAIDETKYKDEYAKKLYKLLAPSADEYGDMVLDFSKYVAGVGGAHSTVVKDFRKLSHGLLKQSNFAKKVAKGGFPQGTRFWWRVQASPTSKMEVVAGTAETAKWTAAREWGIDIHNSTVWKSYKATPLRVFDDKTEQLPSPPESQTAGTAYEVYNRDTDQAVYNYRASAPIPAYDAAIAYIQQHGLNASEFNFRTTTDGDDTRRARANNDREQAVNAHQQMQQPILRWNITNTNGEIAYGMPGRTADEARWQAFNRYGEQFTDQSNIRNLRAMRVS